MELYQLEQLIAVVETGSMGKAAERLYLSRAAISQNIKRLEQELACDLFDREHNRLAITPYGEIVLRHAQNVLDELASLHDEIDAEKRSREALVRIGHFSSPLCYLELPSIARSMPSYKFSVTVCSAALAREGLERGEFDIAIVSSQMESPQGITAIVIDTEQALLSVPPSSPLYEKDSLTLSDLRNAKLLVPDNYPGCSDWYRQLIAEANVNASRVSIVPADEYTATMSASNRCHFSTSLLVGMFGLGNGRKSIPIEGASARRKIIALSRVDAGDVVKAVMNRLRAAGHGPFGIYDVFPYLLFPRGVENLRVESAF